MDLRQVSAPDPSQTNGTNVVFSIKRQADGSFKNDDLANFLHNAYVIFKTKIVSHKSYFI